VIEVNAVRLVTTYSRMIILFLARNGML
jgi:hypothetical protein